MTGTINNLSFGANQVTFMGEYCTFVDINKDEISKEELVQMRLNGTINKWQERLNCYEVELSSDKINWQE